MDYACGFSNVFVVLYNQPLDIPKINMQSVEWLLIGYLVVMAGVLLTHIYHKIKAI